MIGSHTDTIDSTKVVELAKEVINKEIEAVKRVLDYIDENFYYAVQTILECRGRVIVSGVGKSGIIGRKISATLSSLGTPSYFLHPTEAQHGDLGLVTSDDVVIAISYSGESSELITILPFLKEIGVDIIALTSEPYSTLGKMSKHVLLTDIKAEACFLNLAPTSSTTATLVIGDALALVVAQLRGFGAEDFARNHPSGALGKRLTLTVNDLMETDLSKINVNESDNVSNALFKITESRMGAVNIVNDQGKLVGIVTDGDIRRRLVKNINVLEEHVHSIMNTSCKTVLNGVLVREALDIMTKNKINILPVVDIEGRAIGIIHIQDILRSGIK